MGQLNTLGVMGAGSMGTGIAHLAAQSGLDVVLVDIAPGAAERARARIAELTEKAVAKGKLGPAEREAVLGRIVTGTDARDLGAVDFCIEAIVEDEGQKRTAFRALEEICRAEIPLATNTSSLPITAIASAVRDPGRVIGMHFFNPPQVMRLVELVRGVETSDATLASAQSLAARLGKTAVVAQRDTPGFIVNRIMMAQFVEAIRIVEEGIASSQDVDTAVKLGLNYPMGPFELQDFAGVDIGLHVLDVLFAEFKDPRWAAPQSLRALVRAGRTGRKARRGWYDYAEAQPR